MESKLRSLSVERSKSRTAVGQHATQLEWDLGAAIARHKIAVHFQPQYELHTGRGCGVEALARWARHGVKQTPPSTFIPIAERLGLIDAIGISVLHQACEALAAWPSFVRSPPTLSVNVSAQQINVDFCEIIHRIVHATGFPCERLELEITESMLIKDVGAAVAFMQQWKLLGVQIALDDFGTGYSSLSSLARLPIDRLKLDRSFVHRMTFDKKTAAIVRSVIHLGKDLGMAVLAEGIENERQFDMLERWGCPQAQGNLFAASLPGNEAFPLLEMPWGSRPGGARPSGGCHAA